MTSIDQIQGPAAEALASLTQEEVSFLQSLPKAELHAHLNGCIPISTLEELAHEYIASSDSNTSSKGMLEKIENFKAGVRLERIADFFSLFPVIYTLTSTPNALRRVTRAVLNRFLGGDEVVKAKDGAGSATLSMAYAGAKFANSVLRGLNGEKGVVTPTFVKSPLFADQGVEYFSSNVELGPNGVEQIHPIGQITAEEEKLLEACLPELKKNIEKGKAFVSQA
ncbi:hypothetical protein NMY22_g9379 [Coprinellus aureogranulatus]|nr:hypothetical protein NMY22_g9379 [Coprinellus aureogranulatus]